MARRISYWVVTALVALAMVSGGVGELAQLPQTVRGMALLGYPTYFIQIIGFWKVLGGIALLVPGWPRLKEWAYAGIFFNMTGAAVSHAATGAAGWHLVVTLTIAALAVASWALRPPSRILGVLFSATAAERAPAVRDEASRAAMASALRSA
jgi:uncharacterized membrane protein